MSLKKSVSKKSYDILSKSFNDLLTLSNSSNNLEKSKSYDSLENIILKSRSQSLENFDGRCNNKVTDNIIPTKCFEPIKNDLPKKRRERETKLGNNNSPKMEDVMKYMQEISTSPFNELKICDDFSFSYEN